MNHGDDEIGGQIVIAGVFWAAVAMWATYETSDCLYHYMKDFREAQEAAQTEAPTLKP